MKFRKKPVVIDAVQFTGTNITEVRDFCPRSVYMITDYPPSCFLISTLEGDMRAYPNDWIIKGVKGEFYPCKDDIFKATYEAVK